MGMGMFFLYQVNPLAVFGQYQSKVEATKKEKEHKNNYTMLCYAILYYTMLCFTLLYYTILYTIQCCTIP